jgi:hypothetical protein
MEHRENFKKGKGKGEDEIGRACSTDGGEEKYI